MSPANLLTLFASVVGFGVVCAGMGSFITWGFMTDRSK